MTERKGNRKFYVIGTLMIALLMIGAIVGNWGNIFVSNKEIEVLETETIDEKRVWGPITGDHDFDDDSSGFMYGMNYPYQSAPRGIYNENLSNATAYEYHDDLDSELIGETPYNTAYDAVYKYRVNDTVAYDTVNSSWRIDWVRAYLDADFSSNADFNNIAMDIVEIGNNTDFMWFHAFLQDSNGGNGTGFTITHGETFTKFPLMEGYY